MKLNLILLLALALSILLLSKQCTTAKVLRQETETEINTWKDKAGFWRASAQIIQREKNQLSYELIQLQSDYSELVDSKKIVSGTEITTKTERKVILVYDTLNILSFSDRWLSTTFEPSINRLSLLSTDSISLVSYHKWNGLFRPRIYTVESISHNPFTQITGLRSIEFTKPKRVSFVIYAGYGANKDGLGWQIGAGIGYRPFGK